MKQGGWVMRLGLSYVPREKDFVAQCELSVP